VQGIEELIRQAFIQVDILGPHVQEGHYDLIGNGEIILPQLWDTLIEPDMIITMHMWPMDEPVVVKPPEDA
jgi:flagellar basal body rod protein FlgF